MKKKRKMYYQCEVCDAPNAEKVPCNWCYERLTEKTGKPRPKHSLCPKCCKYGCPVRNKKNNA